MSVFKKILAAVLFCMMIITANEVNAQIKLSDKTIVKDSAGNIIPMSSWVPMLQSGEYSIKPIDLSDKNSAYVLYRLSINNSKETKDKAEAVRGSKPKKGAYFSNLNGIDIKGKRINMTSLKGKIVVINYWFIACAPCREEMPQLNKLVEEYKQNKDVVFISITTDKKEEILKFLQSNNFQYQIIADATDLILKDGILAFPTNIVLDKEGRVQYISEGYYAETIKNLGIAIKKVHTGK